MTKRPQVLMVGLHPDVVHYEKWSGMTAEKLIAALRADEERLNNAGYETRICFVDHGETARDTVMAELAANEIDCIMIGAGVRKDPDEFLLFETLVNTVHEHAPQAKICFNTGPTDSVAAVQRWI